VRHSAGEYVRGVVHTNSIESFWSLLSAASWLVSQGEQEVSAAVPRGISIPVQQPQRSRHIRQGNSRVLRHKHWRMSQLSENDASKPVQLEFTFSFRRGIGQLADF
jgi:hypothetical protein